MILLIIFSLVLILIHVSSLKFVIAASKNKSVIEDAQRMESAVSSRDKDFSFKSGPVLLSLGLIFFLNFAQVGYFMACAYVFNNFLVTFGSSILAGYTVYSFIKFLPKIKEFFKKPVTYLKEKTQGFEKGINLVMACLEIAFCSYIVIKIITKYRVFG